MGYPQKDEEINLDNAWKFMYPRHCFLPNLGLMQITMVGSITGRLPLEVIEAGYRETDPEAIAQFRGVCCRGCNIRTCPLNPKSSRSRGGLASLKDGRYEERYARGETYLLELVPQEQREALREIGVEVHIHQSPSRKKPGVTVTLSRGSERHYLFLKFRDRLMIMRNSGNYFLDYDEVRFREEVAASIAHFLGN